MPRSRPFSYGSSARGRCRGVLTHLQFLLLGFLFGFLDGEEERERALAVIKASPPPAGLLTGNDPQPRWSLFPPYKATPPNPYAPNAHKGKMVSMVVELLQGPEVYPSNSEWGHEILYTTQVLRFAAHGHRE